MTRSKRPIAKKEGLGGQSALFVAKAREIGCDESVNEDEIMRRLASQERPPPKHPKQKSKKAAK